jgi:hypothetical protein
MSSWNGDDLRAIAESHDLYISPFREDGITYGTRPWCGPWSSMARSMCARPTANSPAGM